MLRKLNQTFARFESHFSDFFGAFRQQEMLAPSLVGLHSEMGQQNKSPSLTEIIGDIFLMAVPKSRVTRSIIHAFYRSRRSPMQEKQENISDIFQNQKNGFFVKDAVNQNFLIAFVRRMRMFVR
jgi:hypothetical protein